MSSYRRRARACCTKQSARRWKTSMASMQPTSPPNWRAISTRPATMKRHSIIPSLPATLPMMLMLQSKAVSTTIARSRLHPILPQQRSVAPPVHSAAASLGDDWPVWQGACQLSGDGSSCCTAWRPAAGAGRAARRPLQSVRFLTRDIMQQKHSAYRHRPGHGA